MKTKKSAILVYLGAAIVLLCFFLPWISISFFGMSFSVSGMQIASGSGSSGLKNFSSGIGSNTLLFLVPALAVVSIIVAAIGSKKLGSKNTGLAEIISGGIPLLYWAYILMKLSQSLGEASKGTEEFGMKLSLMNVMGIGFWGTAVGLILIIVGGIMGLKGGNQVETPSETPPSETPPTQAPPTQAPPTDMPPSETPPQAPPAA